MRFCEYYSGCKTSPCKNPQTNYQKNHDFDLTLDNNPNYVYIVQYRSPMESLISYYKHGINIGVITEDTKKNWVDFCKKNIVYWKKFINKWVVENKNSNVAFISFEELLKDPQLSITKAILLMDPSNQVDTKKINSIISDLRIKKRYDVSNFKYYDKKSFESIEARTKSEMKLILKLNENNSSKKIPIFYHVPRCAGTFMIEQIMIPSLLKQHKMNREISKSEEEIYPYFQRIHVNVDTREASPGEVVFIVSSKIQPIEPSSDLILSMDEFETKVDLNIFQILGAIVNPVTLGSIKKRLFIEKNLAKQKATPYYFTTLRKTFERERSLFYYLTEVGIWEETYGSLNILDFETFIQSEHISDSWIIRDLLDIPNNKPISDVDFAKAIRIMSDFNVGFVEDLSSLRSDLRKEFGFSTHNVQTGMDPYNKGISHHGKKSKQLPAKNLTAFNERTKYDQKLYAHFRRERPEEIVKRNNSSSVLSADSTKELKLIQDPVLAKNNFRTEQESRLDAELSTCANTTHQSDSILEKIQNVSFPRSGHALLRRCLQLYFGSEFRFCGYHGGCRKSPCINPQTNYQKIHDFNLKLEINPKLTYLIQYRHPVESLISLYKMYVRIGVIKEDTKENWLHFCNKNIIYWKGFIKKWVIENKNPNVVFVPFTELLNNSKDALRKAIKTMTPGTEIDETKVHNIIQTLNITDRGSIKDFKYYDFNFFKEMEDRAKPELKAIHMRRIFNSNRENIISTPLEHISPLRKVPVFYHVPKCAGTFMTFNFLYPEFSPNFKRIDLNVDNSLNSPGDIVAFVVDKDKKLSKEKLSVMKIDEFQKHCEEGTISIEGFIIKPITNGIAPKLSFIEEWCKLSSCYPQYFTILREPLERNKSVFYYLRDQGTWERNYGIFEGMSFTDYVHSELLPDSWIIRNIAGLPDNKPITAKEYDETRKVLSKFKIGFMDDLPKFLSSLTKDFGFSGKYLKESKPVLNQNKVSRTKEKSDLSKQDLIVFTKRIAYDQKLYDHFKSAHNSIRKTDVAKLNDVAVKKNTPKKKLKLLTGVPASGTVCFRTTFINLMLSYYSDLFEPTNKVEDADFIILSAKNISRLDLGLFEKYSQKIVLFLAINRNRKNIRKGKNVDQFYFDKFVKNRKLINFSFSDAELPNVINLPLSYNGSTNISQPDNYWLDFNTSAHKKYFNKVYWSGNTTHKSRMIIQEMMLFANPSFKLQFWKPVGKKSNREAGIYASKNKPMSSEYIDFFKNLSHNDISLCIRGDKPWTHSFFDYLRASNAVAFVDTFYHKLGWEKLGLKKEDMFWFFDTSKQDSKTIYNTLSTDIQNKSLILKKKKLAYDFYTKYIMTDRLYQAKELNTLYTGWMDFFVGKLLELKDNNYKLVDNCLFSQHVDLVKNMTSASRSANSDLQNTNLPSENNSRTVDMTSSNKKIGGPIDRKKNNNRDVINNDGNSKTTSCNQIDELSKPNKILSFYHSHDSALCLYDVKTGFFKHIKLERVLHWKHFNPNAHMRSFSDERKLNVFKPIKNILKKYGFDSVDLLVINNYDKVGECTPVLSKNYPKLFEKFIEVLDLKISKVMNISHHHAHILSAFPMVDYHKYKCGVTFDGVAPRSNETVSFFKNPFSADKASVSFILESISETSYGKAFSLVGDAMNLKGNKIDLAGKIMGAHSYGKPDTEFIRSQNIPVISKKFTTYTINLIKNKPANFFNFDNVECRDFLSTWHKLAELCVVHLFNENIKDKNTPIVYSGGVAQNSVINEALKRQYPNLEIVPHCYDGGLTLGCLYAACNYFKLPLPDVSNFPYLQHDVINEIPSKKTIEETAKILSEGKIVGWHQGQGEIGPRALGNRSILLHPGLKDGKDILNQKVKHREHWRPFAASVLEEHAHEWFDFKGESPYMMRAIKVKKEKINVIKSVVHEDDTCRIQTVSMKQNPVFYNLIKEFYSITGIPMVLNTSLNLGGKPIVGDPKWSKELLSNSDMDFLVVGDSVFSKNSLNKKKDKTVNRKDEKKIRIQKPRTKVKHKKYYG